jgi:hypothetical protein
MINDRIARDLATKGDIEEVRTLHTTGCIQASQELNNYFNSPA